MLKKLTFVEYTKEGFSSLININRYSPVFSKKLDHLDDDNDLDVVTGGYPVPNNKTYKNSYNFSCFL